MSNGDLFYVFGIVLAVSAVLTTLFGLRAGRFPGRAFPLLVLWFAILVGGATTFAVLHAKDEDKASAREIAAGEREIGEAEEAEANPEEAEAPAGEAGGAQGGASSGGAQGPGGTLQLAADPSQIAFDKTSLSSAPGKVTIDFDNPSPIEHDVGIEKDGQLIAVSDRVTNGKASVTATLEPGEYTFVCTVPGHAEAGMKGTLTVK